MFSYNFIEQIKRCTRIEGNVAILDVRDEEVIHVGNRFMIYALYPEYSNNEPHDTTTMNKLMTWYGIEMKTLTDNSTSKIAELILQGVNMGIIEGRKILNKKDSCGIIMSKSVEINNY